MTAKKPSRSELEAELKVLRRQRSGGAIASVMNNLIRWAGTVAIAGFVYMSIASLAGQTTNADIGVTVIGNIKLSEVFAFLFGGGGIVYGLRQRALRKSTIERLQDRIKKLEAARDPNRTSSGLTSRGDTHPYDR